MVSYKEKLEDLERSNFQKFERLYWALKRNPTEEQKEAFNDLMFRNGNSRRL